MNKITSLEQYASVIIDALVTLTSGNVQRLNDRIFYPVFEAEAPRATVPEWRFSCYPKFSKVGNDFQVAGLQLGVNIANATMGGHSQHIMVKDPGEVASALNQLETFRQEALKKCRHFNHRFVANLGRCYNQYKCNDCGMTFNIDSGD